MEFAALLTQLIVNGLLIIFILMLIILAIESIKCVNQWRKVAQNVSDIHFWISLFRKTPSGFFNRKKKTRTE